MAFTVEPEIVYPEQRLQQVISHEIQECCRHEISLGSLLEYFTLESFGLDIAVFLRFPNGRSASRFFELKSFGGQRAGGVGFGNQHGEGREVDLLLLDEQELGLADESIRWILADGFVSVGGNRYAIFNNHQARDAAMGGVRRRKQNNLRVDQLMLHAVTWQALSDEIRRFLTQG